MIKVGDGTGAGADAAGFGVAVAPTAEVQPVRSSSPPKVNREMRSAPAMRPGGGFSMVGLELGALGMDDQPFAVRQVRRAFCVAVDLRRPQAAVCQQKPQLRQKEITQLMRHNHAL